MQYTIDNIYAPFRFRPLHYSFDVSMLCGDLYRSSYYLEQVVIHRPQSDSYHSSWVVTSLLEEHPGGLQAYCWSSYAWGCCTWWVGVMLSPIRIVVVQPIDSETQSTRNGNRDDGGSTTGSARRSSWRQLIRSMRNGALAQYAMRLWDYDQLGLCGVQGVHRVIRHGGRNWQWWDDTPVSPQPPCLWGNPPMLQEETLLRR